jgi:hypothetical protein
MYILRVIFHSSYVMLISSDVLEFPVSKWGTHDLLRMILRMMGLNLTAKVSQGTSKCNFDYFGNVGNVKEHAFRTVHKKTE